MTYSLIVASLEDVSPIPGADRVVSATACGHRLVVGADRKAGDLGVVFPAEGVLDLGFARAAGLLARDPDTGAKLGGMLENPPLIRCLTIRGVRTDGLWIPLDTFWRAVEQVALPLAVRWDTPADGDEVGSIQFVSDGAEQVTEYEVARKYLPPVRAQRSGGGKGAPPPRPVESDRPDLEAALPRHYSTPHAQAAARRIPLGARVWATEKGHGRSGATGLVKVPGSLPAWKRAANRVARLFKRAEPFATYAPLSRSRNHVLRPDADRREGDMLADIHEYIAPRLRPGEVVYYEIVGYYPHGKPIQRQRPNGADADATALRERWGDEVTYSYGCAPDGEPIVPGRPYPLDQFRAHGFAGLARRPQQRVFAYRMTRDGLEVPFQDMRRRALEIGLEVFQVLGSWTHARDGVRPERTDGTEDAERRERLAATRATVERARVLAEGVDGGTGLSSLLDRTHPREGVVLRADAGEHLGTPHVACKYKAFPFRVLEGHGKDRGERDVEELDGE